TERFQITHSATSRTLSTRIAESYTLSPTSFAANLSTLPVLPANCVTSTLWVFQPVVHTSPRSKSTSSGTTIGQRSSICECWSEVAPNVTSKLSWNSLPQYSMNSSEKKFQSHESVSLVAPGGSGGRQIDWANEPEALVSPRPVETSAIFAPSVGSQVPSAPTTRPSPTTLNPATLALKPLEYSKLGLTITEVAMLLCWLPTSVDVAG